MEEDISMASPSPSSSPSPSYQVATMSHSLEDILICVDTDLQIDLDMKAPGAKGNTLPRVDAIKQALFLFVYSKLAMHPHHRFSFTTLTHTVPTAPPRFTSDMEVITTWIRNLSSSGTFPQCDLSMLFRLAASESKKTQKRGRILRVILIYCRSDVVPTYRIDWPQGHYSFTFDALYLHDKPSQLNCPQQVYDVLVEALERVSVGEGYIYESGSGLTRILFRQMCCLLAHPQQRCGQDDFNAPKDISKAVPVVDCSTGSVPTKREDDVSVQ